jgi:hypothetical protein
MPNGAGTASFLSPLVQGFHKALFLYIFLSFILADRKAVDFQVFTSKKRLQMGEIALVDGRKCAVRWEKLRSRWEKLRKGQMGENALRWEKLR